ncbi:GDSL-type esterase/lipase family protein [Pedobacter arcticus]|uniref:GDSL-type esterase/lipase family protein n=1 Tax=Pedobacter arcticus TaxID=752140 RepID=UPI0002E978BF|nr:GDSL-type esterase/lipase family protein [Pedobacter arcticus]
MKRIQILLFIYIVLFSFGTMAQSKNRPNSQAGNTKKDSVEGVNLFKIAYFGSSVPYGQGATNNDGYTNIYTKILDERTKNGGYPWETVNISIPGNNTVGVLNRYTRDLTSKKLKYVIFALALGNEGIHENGEPAFDQFKKNIKILVEKARADGMTPVITNSYTRNDYNLVDYGYIKQMNLFIHLLDVPSVNLLGAVDDLKGRWSNGYWADSAHPNDKGHREMAYTLVPSLFDALNNKKPIPKKLDSSSSILKKRNHTVLSFVPENIVHPFTVAFTFNSSSSGKLMAIEGADGESTISNENGVLKYTSPKGNAIIGKTPINDGKWHKVVFTHYHAEGVSTLYCDSTAQGNVKGKLFINSIKFGGNEMPKKVFYRDLMFWRSGMNSEEVRYITRDSLLKSSLELYAPLSGARKKLNKANIVNLAQSRNKLVLIEKD